MDKIKEVMGLVVKAMQHAAEGDALECDQIHDAIESKLRELLEREPEKESLRECAMCDLSYANGMLSGWNFCVSDDGEGFEKARSQLTKEAMRVLRELREGITKEQSWS